MGDYSVDLPGGIGAIRGLKEKIIALLAGVLMAALATAKSAEVNLEWDPVSDSRITKYEIHYGLSPATYIQTVTVPKEQTTASIIGLAEGRWYFAARACSDTDCSGFSNEVAAEIARDEIPAPQNLRVASQ